VSVRQRQGKGTPSSKTVFVGPLVHLVRLRVVSCESVRALQSPFWYLLKDTEE